VSLSTSSRPAGGGWTADAHSPARTRRPAGPSPRHTTAPRIPRRATAGTGGSGRAGGLHCIRGPRDATAVETSGADERAGSECKADHGRGWGICFRDHEIAGVTWQRAARLAKEIVVFLQKEKKIVVFGEQAWSLVAHMAELLFFFFIN